jgi:hypothetical protein
MSRNPSGVYSLPAGSVVANGDTSDASDINTPLADIAADLNVARPIVAGGTGATSASAALVNLGLTATAAEINALDGITATVSELNTLDGITATVGELNKLDGLAGDAVGTTDTQTLTNKTLTAPAINGAVSGDSLATQAEAEAGTNNDQLMTPLRTEQAITALSTIRAWVNFNGTGTVAIRASFNVSSITDSGVGDYTVNFTTALTDADYAVVGTCSDSGDGYSWSSNGTARTTTACRIRPKSYGLAFGTDTDFVDLAFMR